MIPVRSPALFSLSSWCFLNLLGWFVIELVIHAEPNRILPLAEQSLQLMMYTSLLSLASLGGCWFADFVRTRACRAAAVCVSTFTMFAWMWNLWFVIPAFRDSNDSQNVYCNNTTFSSNADFCSMTRAAAAFDTGLLAGLFCTWLFALMTFMTSMTPEIPIPTHATILAPHGSMISAEEAGAHNADVNWRTELTEPDDLELMKVCANNPYTYQPLVTRTTMLGYFSAFWTGTSLIGWIVLTCSLISIAANTGIQAWDTTEPNIARLGDPIVQSNWYWLTLSLGATLATSSYSSYRRNRAIIGGAAMLSLVSTLQWVSLFIYAVRRVAYQSTLSTETQYVISDLNNEKNSQYAEVAGMGLITLSELCRSFTLLLRYMTYMIVSKAEHDRVHIPSHVDAPTVIVTEPDNGVNTRYDGKEVVIEQNTVTTTQVDAAGNAQTVVQTAGPIQEMNIPGPAYDVHDADVYIPSYNMGIFHGASVGFWCIFLLQAITLFGWFVLQLVQECMTGLFTPYQTAGQDPYNIAGSAHDRTYYYNEYMFLLSSILVLGAYIPAFFAEREMSVASAVSSMYTSALMCLGFFLLVWTYSYESIYANGTLYSYASNASDLWKRQIQASGVFALVNAFWLLCLFGHSMMRLAERYALVTTWERSRQNIPSAVAWLILMGIGAWAFVTLYYGLSGTGVVTQWQSVTGTFNGSSYIQSYFATQAFLTFASCAITVWIGCYASKLLYAWQSWGWRMAALFSSLLSAAYLVPMIILACIEINDGGLKNGEMALAAAIIVLCAGTVFFLATFSFLIHAAFYAAGPAGAALPPSGMVLRSNEQFTTVKNEQGVMVKDTTLGTVGTATTTSSAGPYEKTTTYVTTTEPAVNPRTGDTTVITHTSPVNQSTVSVQPGVAAGAAPVYEATTQTQYATSGTTAISGLSPVPVPVEGATLPATTTTASQEIRYHDY